MKQKYGLFLPAFIYCLGIISYIIILFMFSVFAGDISGDFFVFSEIIIGLVCLICGKYIDKKVHLGGLVLLSVLLLGSGILSLTYQNTTEIENIFVWINPMSGLNYGSTAANIIMMLVLSALPAALMLLGSKISKNKIEVENLAPVSKRVAVGAAAAFLMLALTFGGLGGVFYFSTYSFEELTHPVDRSELTLFEKEDGDNTICFAIETDDNNQYATEIMQTPFLFIENTDRYTSYPGGGLSAENFPIAVDDIYRNGQLKYLVVFSSNVSKISKIDYTFGTDEQKTISINENEPFAEFFSVSPDMCDDGNKINYSFYAYDKNGNLIDDYISATYAY